MAPTTSARTDAAERRLFVLATVGFAVLSTALGRLLGEEIALQLQRTPTTGLGWRVIGWAIARTVGVDSQFGTGALVGDPLSAGWAWGALAAVVGLAFTAIVLRVLHRSVDDPTREQRDLTVRFLERAWLVLLVVSLGFALYGGRAGVFNGGT